MEIPWIRAIVLAMACCSAWLVISPIKGYAQAEPLDTTICEINKDPKAFNGKTIRIRGFVVDEFENFTINSKSCNRGSGIWLVYADDKSGTSYWAHSPWPDEEIVPYRGESYPLLKDNNFNEFQRLIRAEQDRKSTYQVTAIITGKFFARRFKRYPSGQVIADGGYGHLGCCHLLIVMSVADVTPVRQDHSNIRGVVVDPAGKPLEGVSV